MEGFSFLDIMKSILLTIFACLMMSSPLFSQGTGITHYERKVKSVSLQFPGEQFSSEGYLIQVPDSIYSFGKIRVKKITLDACKANAYQMTFEENVIRNVEFVLSGKKELATFTSALKARFEGRIEETEYGFLVLVGESRVKCHVAKHGKKSRIRLLID